MSIHISINNAVPMVPSLAFDTPINWEIHQGEAWAVVGPNGAGKSILADILQKRIALRCGNVTIDGHEAGNAIQSIAFKDIYSPAQTRDSYYQQRWNSFNRDEMPLVRDILSDFTAEQIDEYSSMGDIASMLDKRIIFLSSGELRKMFIFRMLLVRPKVIIIDNPFIGLDYESREMLSCMLHDMIKSGIICILVVADPDDIPWWITSVLPIKDKHIFSPMKKDDFFSDRKMIKTLFPISTKEKYILPCSTAENPPYENAIVMNDINIHYGEKYILKGVNWTVKCGEKWALTGKNGAGKSTLLSLVCGDNPQAYANDITLFDRKRGTGESIWDIKRRIGYVSPEMHSCYLENIPCIDVVASGMFDTIGLFRRPTALQLDIAKRWLSIFDAENIADKSFLKCSFGEQRLAILVRAFVKNPQILILDEPLHGLDVNKKERVKSVIEAFCAQENKTLIVVSHYERNIPCCVTLKKVLTKSE